MMMELEAFLDYRVQRILRVSLQGYCSLMGIEATTRGQNFVMLVASLAYLKK